MLLETRLGHVQSSLMNEQKFPLAAGPRAPQPKQPHSPPAAWPLNLEVCSAGPLCRQEGAEGKGSWAGPASVSSQPVVALDSTLFGIALGNHSSGAAGNQVSGSHGCMLLLGTSNARDKQGERRHIQAGRQKTQLACSPLSPSNMLPLACIDLKARPYLLQEAHWERLCRALMPPICQNHRGLAIFLLICWKLGTWTKPQ